VEIMLGWIIMLVKLLEMKWKKNIGQAHKILVFSFERVWDNLDLELPLSYKNQSYLITKPTIGGKLGL
jgi:hypothetical protein